MIGKLQGEEGCQAASHQSHNAAGPCVYPATQTAHYLPEQHEAAGCNKRTRLLGIPAIRQLFWSRMALAITLKTSFPIVSLYMPGTILLNKYHEKCTAFQRTPFAGMHRSRNPLEQDVFRRIECKNASRVPKLRVHEKKIAFDKCKTHLWQLSLYYITWFPKEVIKLEICVCGCHIDINRVLYEFATFFAERYQLQIAWIPTFLIHKLPLSMSFREL